MQRVGSGSLGSLGSVPSRVAIFRASVYHCLGAALVCYQLRAGHRGSGRRRRRGQSEDRRRDRSVAAAIVVVGHQHNRWGVELHGRNDDGRVGRGRCGAADPGAHGRRPDLPEVELRKDTAEWLGSGVRRAVAEPRPDIVGAVLAEGVGGAVALDGAVNKAVYVIITCAYAPLAPPPLRFASPLHLGAPSPRPRARAKFYSLWRERVPLNGMQINLNVTMRP
jgi:hypothetical protein